MWKERFTGTDGCVSCGSAQFRSRPSPGFPISSLVRALLACQGEATLAGCESGQSYQPRRPTRPTPDWCSCPPEQLRSSPALINESTDRPPTIDSFGTY